MAGEHGKMTFAAFGRIERNSIVDPMCKGADALPSRLSCMDKVHMVVSM